MQNYGAFLEKDGAGFKGQISLTGLKSGDIDLSKSLWTYQVLYYSEIFRILFAAIWLLCNSRRQLLLSI